MLKVRIIPTLLWKNIGLVKGTGFDSWRRVGTVMPAIKVYNTRDVDELILLDISATSEKRDLDYDAIEEYSSECFVPLTIGGGIHDLEQVRRLLFAGADKVVINSAAYSRPELITEASQRFGSQCIVASIDARRIDGGGYQCYSHLGTRPTGQEPKAWAKELEERGAGEILITSIERDGTMEGYDIDLIRQVTGNVNIPVIASGGAGNYKDMYEALESGMSSAVAAASIFHFTEQTPMEAKHFLSSKGLPVRGLNEKNASFQG
jgi:imidazole glycerol-phosphate synthase subunit HisF